MSESEGKEMKKDPSVKIVTVTPEMAAKWLESNTHNRKLLKTRVQGLARAMTQGDWRLNGDAIRFYEDGRVADGQHRLSACVKSGVSFQTIVIDGLKEDVSPTIDKGATRTTADNFVLDFGVSTHDARIIAAASNFIIAHDVGMAAWGDRGGSLKEFTSTQMVEDWYVENIDEIQPAIDALNKHFKRASYFIPKGAILALLVLFRRCDDVFAEDFLSRVINGHDIEKDSPEDYLRTAMLRAMSAARKMQMKYRVYSVAKVFKSRLAGREIKHSSNTCFRIGVDNVPTFPGFGKIKK